MNKNLLIILLAIILLPTLVNAQFETKTSYFPSSNGAFSKQAASSVDLHTGALNVSIPLGEISAGNSKFPISVSYKGTGHKIEEYASSVGLGWNLNMGGYISRMVRGLPDETANGFCGANHIGANMSTVTFNTVDKAYTGEWDGEPDLFFASLPSGSFYFVLKPDGTPLIMDNSNFKFITNPFNNYSQTYDKVNGYWILRDGNGTEYKLGTSVANEIVQSKISTQSTSQEYTSSWYLIEVNSTSSNEKLKIEYENIGEINQLYYNTLKVEAANLTTEVCSFTYGPFTYIENTELKILNRLIAKRIHSDLEQIKLVYSNRTDVDGEKKLDFIDYYDINNTLINRVKFYTSYFGVGGMSGTRLKLDALSKISSNNEILRIATFNYSTVDLPSRNDTAYDHWGYYNNNTTGTAMFPTANKSPDLTRTMANVLLSMENNMGGKTKFNYELNDYHNGTTNVAVGGLRVSQITEENATEILSSEKYIYADTLTNISYGKVQSINVVYDELATYIPGWGSVAGYPVPCGMSVHRIRSKGYVSHMDSFNNALIYSSVIKKARDGSKVKYNFSSYTEYPDIPSLFMTLSASVTSIGGASATRSPTTAHKNARGAILEEYYYNNNNILVKEINYEYNKINDGQVSGLSSQLNSFDYVFGTKWYITNAYSYLREFLLLKKKIEKDYSTSKTLQNTTDIHYDNATHYLPTRIYQTASDGIVNEKTFSYPQDMVVNSADPTGIFQQMVDKNIVNVAIEQSDRVSGSITQKIKTNYTSPFSNIYLPSNVEVYNPLTQQSEISNVYSAYDNRGNLLESYVPNGPKTVNVWGYKGRYLLAEIKNSDLSAVNSVLGGLTAINTFSDIVSPTPTAVNTFLQPLRSNLPNSLIVTNTYRPLIGINTTTDENNFTTSNEYDSFGRLQAIKDNTGSITKSYKYNYSNPTIPNSSTYYSGMFSQTFVKACPTGQTGSSVTYTVMPNLYTSLISQQAADQLALDDIALNGQNYANANGSCTSGATVDVFYYFPYGREFLVTFSNTNTNTVENYTLSGGGTLTMPEGNYYVSINELSYTGNYDIYFNGVMQTGVYVQFGHMFLSGTTDIYVQEL